MRYAEAIAAAPAGRAHFRAADVARLSKTAINLIFQPGPSAAPLGDAAAALQDEPESLHGLARALSGDLGGRLGRIAQRHFAAEAKEQAARRLVAGCFWYLAYELAAELWDRLAAAESVAPALVQDLPADGCRVLDVGAGGGRLAIPLSERAAALVAVEPSPPLRRMLAARGRLIRVVAGEGHRLPIRDGWADLTVSCATFGPHPPLGGAPVLGELLRVTCPGGTVALAGPERPSWWQDHGFTLTRYPQPHANLDPELEAFFGPAHPPHVLLTRRA